MENCANITITPINLKSPTTLNGKKAKNDYNREKQSMDIIKWDDSRYNNSNIGDYFGFVHQGDNRVEIHIIENIALANTRPNYWDIPEHKRRNVLYLSSIIEEITWDELKNRLQYKEKYFLRGTQRSNKKILI